MSQWRAEFSENGGYDCMFHAWHVKDGNRYIATLDMSNYGQRSCVDEFRSEEAARIARLIAAAPELLEAVKRALAVEDSTTQGSERTLREGYVPLLRAAIAKAEGTRDGKTP